MKGRGHVISNAVFRAKRHLKRRSIEDSRKAPRFDFYFAMPTLKSVNQIGGDEAELINISRCGALIESPERMPLGSRISLRFITEETSYVVKGQIARCNTSSTNNRVFQSAIDFDEDFTILPTIIGSLKLLENNEGFLK